MRYLAIIFLLSGCGSATVPSISNGLDSECLIKDSCTYANVTGYQCQSLRYQPDIGDGTTIPLSHYNGYPCIIAKEDFQTDPSCNPAQPNQTCTSGWGSSSTTFPCCRAIQGPGPSVTL